MTTLVTGATSGLGRNAVEALASQQMPVRATGRNRQAGAALRAQRIDFAFADLATASAQDLARLLDGIDTVWHCAALSSPWGRRQDFVAANVVATRRLALAAARSGVRRFVHVSTPSLYFDYRHRRDIPETFRAARFVNHYAATKAQAEDAIVRIARAQRGTTFAILRPRGIFGAHDNVLLPRLLRVLRERGGRLPLPRGGRARIDLTYAGNVVHAMQLATTCSAPVSGDAFNVTNGEPVMLRDVLDALFARLSIDCRIVDVPYRALDLAARAMQAWARVSKREPQLTRYGVGALHYDMTLDIGKARAQLGYRPRFALDAGIDATACWIRAHGNAYGL